MRQCSSADRVMWVTPDRVFYAGLLGSPAMHTKGAIVVHVAIEAPLRVRQPGLAWQSTKLVVMQPGVPYQVACEGRHVLVLVIEPETVQLDALPPVLRASGAVDDPAFVAHVRQCHAQLVVQGAVQPLAPDAFDPLFFGDALPGRTLDPRVAAVVDRIKHAPEAPLSAQDAAQQAGLSFSRFLHLFKQEVGQPFRSFRTWKRARSLLNHVNRDQNLLHVALDIGYPDSTHFSHSIRQTYGLKPRDIFAGSRKLRIIRAPQAQPASAGLAWGTAG